MGFYYLHRDGSTEKLTTCKKIDHAGKRIGKNGETVVYADSAEEAREVAAMNGAPSRLFCAHCEHTHVAVTAPETSNIVSP